MLVEGKIEAGKSCHHKDICGMKHSCDRENFIDFKYSCGLARLFELSTKMTSERKKENESKKTEAS